MKIYLLTHERELTKPSNTGKLVKACLQNQVEVIVWRRKEPNKDLVKLIRLGEVVMLFPKKLQVNDQIAEANTVNLEPYEINTLNKKNCNAGSSINDFQTFLIIDSTWQEARKIYNRSPYLHEAKKITLKSSAPSIYRKRRNQIEGGLSTVECVIELLKQKKELSRARLLQDQFELFNLS